MNVGVIERDRACLSSCSVCGVQLHEQIPVALQALCGGRRSLLPSVAIELADLTEVEGRTARRETHGADGIARSRRTIDAHTADGVI